MPFFLRTARVSLALAVVLAALVLAVAPALASDDGHRGPGRGDRDRDEDEGRVAVNLSDVTDEPAFTWAVSATPSISDEKKITFDVHNISKAIPHQFLVVKTDLAPDALPRLGPGLGVDETKVDVVARLEAPTATPPNTLAAGQEGFVDAKLKKGQYVLICNLNATGTPRRSHYDEGMRTAFRVGDDDHGHDGRGHDG